MRHDWIPSPAQSGLGDMDPAEFREAGRKVADMVAGYLARLESYPVLPDIKPGSIRAALPPAPPSRPEPLEAILDDFARLIEPNITHWQHPGFLAYFPSVATGPGILGEWLSAGLNSNVMMWRNAPSSTELEEVVVSWLRQMLGLPPAFDGMFTDTASISSLLSLVAARHVIPGLEAREEGLAGRPGVGPLRLYASAEAHSSIEKAAIVVGAGRRGLRRIPADGEYRMRPELLERAIAEDRAAGWLPFCVVATLGTTSSTSLDPVDRLAAICEREGLWLHVDAAYGGAAALAPEHRGLFAGWERADSIVVNPHKWMFTPFDASLLLFRRPEAFRDAFSLVPEYLRTPDTGGAHNFSEYGIQLGRRFRALKLWMLIRWFGAEGMAARIREHIRMARAFASWVEADTDWELLAPVPLATVCFRFRPAALREGMEPADSPATEPGRPGESSRAGGAVGPQAGAAARIDCLNERIMDAVNRSGEIFLSHTRLADRYTIRVSIGNPRTQMRHLENGWRLLREAAARALAEGR